MMYNPSANTNKVRKSNKNKENTREVIMSKSKENTNTRLGIHMSKKSNDDEYYTPESAIKMLQLSLNDSKFPPNKKTTCWECFGSNFNYIESPQYIKTLGYDVIANGKNFWENNYGKFVISNPPYHTPRGERNIKERVIERLCKLDKPFCLLMPTTYLQTKSFKRMVDTYGNFQIIMPSAKIQFYQVNPVTNEKIKKGKCSFYTCWFCWNMGFKSDFIMV